MKEVFPGWRIDAFLTAFDVEVLLVVGEDHRRASRKDLGEAATSSGRFWDVCAFRLVRGFGKSKCKILLVWIDVHCFFSMICCQIEQCYSNY